jgi:shikimate dehydrogenase
MLRSPDGREMELALTARAFVVGHPIEHSRSPLIHGYWLREHGLDGSYQRLDVAPADFEVFLREFAARGFRGGNVTIPHKEAAFRLADTVTDRARRAAAVNTLWIEDGRIQGDNTDVFGFVANLDQQLGSSWQCRTVLVLGGGGAARGVLAGLLERATDRILVANRTAEKAEDVAALDRGRIQPIAWPEISDRLSTVDLLVNTTSLGMKGQPGLDINLSRLPPHAVVTDVVYVPLETPLLAAARSRGLRTVDGLGMLLHQAIPGFARWFGVIPEVTPELRALIEADLEARR